MAHGLIRQSGGNIKIYSEIGLGTTVKIYLPRSFDAETEMPVRLSDTAAEALGGTETILVVEDAPKVQSVVEDMQTSLRYRVLRADNAQSALCIIRSGVQGDLCSPMSSCPASCAVPIWRNKPSSTSPTSASCLPPAIRRTPSCMADGSIRACNC